MAYKTIDQNFSFVDIAINKNADKNRSLLFLRYIVDAKKFIFQKGLNKNSLKALL